MLLRFFLILALFFINITESTAQKIEKHSNAKLLYVSKTTNNKLNILLNIKLDKDWDTYWKTPGEVGLAPTFDWSKSKNLKNANIRWPFPTRFNIFDIDNFGYLNKVSFPIEITPISPNSPIDINLKLELLICNKICIPQTHYISMRIPANAKKDSNNYELFVNAQKYIPSQAEGFSIRNIWVEKDSLNKISINLIAKTSKIFSDKIDMFIEVDPYLSFAKPKTSYDPSTKILYLKALLRSEDSLKEVLASLKNKSLKITFTDKNKSFEITNPEFTNKKTSVSTILNPKKTNNNISLKLILFAFLGGLILNLMPCVLPVLSIKILSVLKHGGKDHRIHRWNLFKAFTASAAGIIFSFWLIAALLITLKLTGNSLGWGIQFQYPPFIIFLIIVLSGFSINLWGSFEIPLPKFILKKSYSINERDPSLLGHFLTGSLATLLATPCSAPFLGTAVAFALAGSSYNIFIIFTVLGVGMATPYIALALSPRVFKYMPKPGAWMVVLKKILSIALALTVAWLIGVLTTIYTVPTIDEGWQKFDEALISPAVKNGRIVLVDVTADWCLTCKVNKGFILENEEISTALKKKNVLKLQADWTNKNATIANYLKKYGRYGVPFNIIYGPKAPEGIILSELLSTKEILSALKKASAK